MTNKSDVAKVRQKIERYIQIMNALYVVIRDVNAYLDENMKNLAKMKEQRKKFGDKYDITFHFKEIIPIFDKNMAVISAEMNRLVKALIGLDKISLMQLKTIAYSVHKNIENQLQINTQTVYGYYPMNRPNEIANIHSRMLKIEFETRTALSKFE